MNRRNLFAISAVSVLGLALLAGNALGAPKAKFNKRQLVGTWTMTASENVRPDGTKVEPYGSNPKSILIFDGGGHYSLTIVRSDLPKFSGSTSDQGTAEENKAVVAGIITHFGTYSINEADRTITTHVEASSFPNITGTDQKRSIISLNADELRYANATTATGTKAEVTWKRAK
jgi:hypothetical protein